MSDQAVLPPLPQHASADEIDVFGNTERQRHQLKWVRSGVILLIVAAVLGVGVKSGTDYYHSLRGTIVQVGTDAQGSWVDISTGDEVRRAHYNGVDVTAKWKAGDAYPFLANFVESDQAGTETERK